MIFTWLGYMAGQVVDTMVTAACVLALAPFAIAQKSRECAAREFESWKRDWQEYR